MPQIVAYANYNFSHLSQQNLTRLVYLLFAGIWNFVAFGLGLAAGIFALRRKHFMLTIVGVSLLLVGGVVAVSGTGIVGGFWMLLGIPAVVLSILSIKKRVRGLDAAPSSFFSSFTISPLPALLFRSLPIYPKNVFSANMTDSPVRLSYPCDSCGHMVGGGLHYCPKCSIALCFHCASELMLRQKNPIARARCPMCEEYFPKE